MTEKQQINNYGNDFDEFKQSIMNTQNTIEDNLIK